MKFLNTTKVIGKNYEGYQVKISQNGIPYEPYVPRITNTSLRKVLQLRNEIWKKLNTTADGILLKQLSVGTKPGKSNTGVNGVTRSVHIEKNGTVFDVFVLRLKNLHTGRHTSNNIRIHHYSSEKKAFTEAKRIVKQNIEAYNSIVDVYNEMALNDAEKLAEYEARMLKSKLPSLLGFDHDRWALALEMVFPDGPPQFVRRRK